MRKLTKNLMILFGCLLGMTGPAFSDSPPLIFAASSLSPVFKEIGELYYNNTNVKPVFSFASSGALARQISSGAPADLFISANLKWADWLKNKKHSAILKDKAISTNRLILIAGKNVNSLPITIHDLPKYIGASRLAIGDPNHVPAGIYTKQSLSHLGLWNVLKDQIAPMQNVRAALYLVQTNVAPFGIVYQSDLYGNDKVNFVAALPKATHDPIIYQAILLNTQNEWAESFYKLLETTQAQEIFKKFGFIPAQ